VPEPDLPVIPGFVVLGPDPFGNDRDRLAAIEEGTRHRVGLQLMPPLYPGERDAIGAVLARYGQVHHPNLAAPTRLAESADVLVLPGADHPTLATAEGADAARGALGRVLADVAAALAALHEAGLAHGQLGLDSVAVAPGGEALLVGSGVLAALHELAPREIPAPEAAADVEALHRLVAAVDGGERSAAGPLAGAVAALGAGAGVAEVAEVLRAAAGGGGPVEGATSAAGAAPVEPVPAPDRKSKKAKRQAAAEPQPEPGPQPEPEPRPEPEPDLDAQTEPAEPAEPRQDGPAAGRVQADGERDGAHDEAGSEPWRDLDEEPPGEGSRLGEAVTWVRERPWLLAVVAFTVLAVAVGWALRPGTGDPAASASAPSVGIEGDGTATPAASTGPEATSTVGVELCGPPEPAPETSPPVPDDWITVIDELYTARSAALVTGQVDLLCDVYDSSSAGLVRDLELDAAYARQNVRPDELTFVVSSATLLSQEGALVTLEITDELQPYNLVNAEGTVVAELPGIPSATWQARLVPDASGEEWRFG
jgi:hypothetical protein